MVADFGIALAISAAGGGRLTETGMSVGTPHYMSPEQASADRDVSARSDIYALGCVLYEMLAGDPPHTGSTAQAVLMRILTEDPRDLAEVRRSVPEHVRDAVTKALEKLPADRFESAEAFRQALTDESFRYTSRPRPRPATAQPREQGGGWTRDTRTRALLGVSLLLLAALGWLALRAPGAGNVVPQPSHRFLVTDSLLAPNDATLAVSADGDLVYAGLGADGEGPRLRIRRASNPRATAIPSTSGAGFPTFSPDGRWLAFNADGQVRKVQLTTGTQITLIPEGGVGPIFSVEWASDGTVITAGEGGIHRVPDTGGETEQVSE
ncbi:MAG: protein kinase, partial [Gemmatimonadetes bacterium]|nr:protein kinase [Gemmatimonadota bacterium]NIX43746.1 protein kinase [Gemmatimonadota bacterium]